VSAALQVLARRAGLYALAAWTAVTLNFLLPRLMPGDPASVMLARFQGQLEPEALAALRETFGLTDASLWTQYGQYLGHLLRGDLGTSVAYFPAPVSEVLIGALGWTVLLAGSALILSFGAGTALGAIVAWRRGGWLDKLLPPVLAFIGSFPYFWLAMLLMAVFGFHLRWAPTRHAYADGLTPGLDPLFLLSVAQHLALPLATLVLVGIGGWVMAMRATMIGVLGDGPVTWARARGLPPHWILWRVAARSALLPSLTGFGMALGYVLGGTLLTEIIFGYPGQGYLLLQAVQAQDHPLMQGIFLTITLAVLGANLLVDAVTVALDPRTRR
jgi:peptide/nickel transport system permease protein